MNFRKWKKRHLKTLWIAEIIAATLIGAGLYQVTTFVGFMYLIYCYYFFIRVRPWLK